MAEDYYSLEEVIEKLGKTKEDIKKLVSEGKLREYRDGPKPVYGMKEVDALVSEIAEVDTVVGGSGVELVPDETEESSEIPGDLSGGIDLGELTGADTTISTSGINVLGDTDDEYKLTGDTEAETQIVESEGLPDDLGSLDGDLSMDSVGSGSGLLDLSLQADDTSLGAVLDDILPAAGEAGAAMIDVEEVGAEAEDEEIFEQAEPEEGISVAAEAAVMPPRYIEPEADAGSKLWGVALVVPLLAMIYATIVLVAGFRGVAPTILKSVEGIILYIVIGMIVVFCIIAFVAFLGGSKGKSKKAGVYQQQT